MDYIPEASLYTNGETMLVATIVMAMATVLVAVAALIQVIILFQKLPRIKCVAHTRQGFDARKGEWTAGFYINRMCHFGFYVSFRNMSSATAVIRSILVRSLKVTFAHPQTFVLYPNRIPVNTDLINIADGARKMNWKIEPTIPSMGAYNVTSLRDLLPINLKPYEFRHIIIAVPIPEEDTDLKAFVRFEFSCSRILGRPKELCIQGWGDEKRRITTPLSPIDARKTVFGRYE